MRLGSWATAVGEGTCAGVSLAGSVGGEAGFSEAGIRLLVSVEIRSTILDRQSRLDTTELRSLFTPPFGVSEK